MGSAVRDWIGGRTEKKKRWCVGKRSFRRAKHSSLAQDSAEGVEECSNLVDARRRRRGSLRLWEGGAVVQTAENIRCSMFSFRGSVGEGRGGIALPFPE